jgi:hypothetical protein
VVFSGQCFKRQLKQRVNFVDILITKEILHHFFVIRKKLWDGQKFES